MLFSKCTVCVFLSEHLQNSCFRSRFSENINFANYRFPGTHMEWCYFYICWQRCGRHLFHLIAIQDITQNFSSDVLVQNGFATSYWHWNVLRLFFYIKLILLQLHFLLYMEMGRGCGSYSKFFCCSDIGLIMLHLPITKLKKVFLYICLYRHST